MVQTYETRLFTRHDAHGCQTMIRISAITFATLYLFLIISIIVMYIVYRRELKDMNEGGS